MLVESNAWRGRVVPLLSLTFDNLKALSWWCGLLRVHLSDYKVIQIPLDRFFDIVPLIIWYENVMWSSLCTLGIHDEPPGWLTQGDISSLIANPDLTPQCIKSRDLEEEIYRQQDRESIVICRPCLVGYVRVVNTASFCPLPFEHSHQLHSWLSLIIKRPADSSRCNRDIEFVLWTPFHQDRERGDCADDYKESLASLVWCCAVSLHALKPDWCQLLRVCADPCRTCLPVVDDRRSDLAYMPR